ncbi:MAG TPA: APC family permease [Polyangia bacterium]|nr:APC family permease [Polyangia bacterium]
MSSHETTGPEEKPSLLETGWRVMMGRPRDFKDPGVFHKISLVAFLAWVGLGADGLSSSAYGPDESFRSLLEHGNTTYLAAFMALATALTVFVLSYAYSRIIEHFPTGGGGYVVASKLLGEKAGLVSGSALLVDYILTITVSIASGGDALFNMLPLAWHPMKLSVEFAVITLLIVLNLRGVKESVTPLVPIFLVFVITHLVLILGGIGSHIGHAPAVARDLTQGLSQGIDHYGAWGLFVVFMSAYSRGAGTYTGIEAVSNGLQIMREPRVATGRRTMLYMSVSLAFTAGGILLCYLLFGTRPQEGKTLNGVLVAAFAANWQLLGLPVGKAFVVLTLASEGALLFVAAQTGFIDGPRVMSNMAVDSWLPRRFASLSDRLTTKDGVLLLGAAAIALLHFTHGNVDALVVMYAINVFITFSLSQLGMCRFWLRKRSRDVKWGRHISVHVLGLAMCLVILAFTIVLKFSQGAWLTLLVTMALIAVCLLVKGHYRAVSRQLALLDADLDNLVGLDGHGGEPDPRKPTAVLLVAGYGGLGVHSMLSIQRTYPGYFANLVFVSVAVHDSGTFKGAAEVDSLRRRVEETLQKYATLAKGLGWNSSYRMAEGLDAVQESTRLCISIAQEFPRVVFFAGKLIWKRETWMQRILHNETAYQVERRLHWKGLAMAVLPVRVGGDAGAPLMSRKGSDSTATAG